MITLSLIITVTLATGALGCKRPTDYRELPTNEVLAKSELTIVGTMTGYDVVPQPDDYLHVKYNTNVTCVLRNTKQVSIPSTLNITSIHFQTVGNANTCELNFIGSIEYNKEAIIMIRPYEGMPGEFFFNDVNFQGPFFYIDQDSQPDVCSSETVGYNGTSNSAPLLSSLLVSMYMCFIACFLL